MARDEKDYMTNPSLIQRVTSYITQGGRPEYQEATEHPKTLSVYNEPYAKQNGAALGTFEYYVDDAGRLTKGIADAGISDPFTKINSQIDMDVSLQAPKVKIDGNRVVVQAPKEILSSPLVSQIKEELRTLKGSDLKSAEVQNAINALNEEISTGLKDSLLNSATGWTRDQYNDYQYARQSVAGTNPMKSSNRIKGYDKDGNIIMKTPQEWVDYYRQFYNTDERTKAYEKSFYSSDPYERTMALVMGQGKKTPVYGFDTAEKMGEGWKAFVNQMGKFPEGTLRFLAEDNDTRRLEGIVNNKRIPVESMRKFDINTEDEFNAKKESIKGKSWDELSDDDKAFVAILGVSREGELEKEADTTEAMKNYRGSKTNTFAWDTNQQDYERAERRAARQIGTEDLNNATSEDKEKSKDAIDRILSDNSFEKYRTARNNYDTWQGYQDWTEEGEKELASTADWSGSEQWWGNLTGTIGRYLWENAVVQGATGGISAKSLANPNLIRGAKAGGFAMNSVSDRIGAHIVGKLAQNGIAPTSRFGRNAMQFTANLIGTIPEDILQTSVDNVLTYNIKDNAALLDPTQMTENFKNNLIFMAGLNALRAGRSAVKRALLAKQIAKAADLDEELVIGKFADADDVARAVSKGQEIKIDGDKVSTVDVDGNETVLKNTTPEQANIAEQVVAPQKVEEEDAGITAKTSKSVSETSTPTYEEKLAAAYKKDFDSRKTEFGEGTLWRSETAHPLGDVTFYTPQKWYAETYENYGGAAGNSPSFENKLTSNQKPLSNIYEIKTGKDADVFADMLVSKISELDGRGGFKWLKDIEAELREEARRRGISEFSHAENEFMMRWEPLLRRRVSFSGDVDFTNNFFSKLFYDESIVGGTPIPTKVKEALSELGVEGISLPNPKADASHIGLPSEVVQFNWGNETVLKNTTPEEANIAQQTIRPQESAETATTVTEEAIEPVKKKTTKEWKENPTYDQEYSLRRAEDVMEGRTTLDDYLEEQKERMWEALKNSNEGTETFYHRDETGQIDGRNTVSYNGTLYRQLYEEYGGRPTKAEFGEAFDDVIKNGENSKYYEGFKEFDVEGDYSRGYNAGNEEIDTILALKEDIESAPAKATESAPESEPGTGAARTEVDEPKVGTEATRVETEEAIEPAKMTPSAQTEKVNGAYTENALLNKSKEIYDKKMSRINKINDSAMRDSRAKAAGMEKAATDRLITGKFTARERQNLHNRYEKIFKGKDVIVDGKSAKVANPSVYGRVKVEFEDGTTKVVDPADISPKYTSAEDVRRDMWEKFVRPEIERRLGVKLENGIVRSTEEMGEAPRAEVETTRTEVEEPRVEAETTRVEAEEPKVMVEVDTPDGPVRTETVDYTFNKIDDVATPGAKIENTPAGVKHWHTKALDFVINLAQNKLFREFRTRFGDITTSEFDWIFHNSKNGMTPEQIIGTVDPVSGRTITQNTIDAARWWANNPIVQKLRVGSRKSLGLEGDVNILGYLPHTSYDPANLSYDEALTGQLWREYTGKSTVGDDGKFTGYGGTFEGRFRTYASNMLWDIRGKEVAAAKLIEEAQMEGKTLTPEQAMRMAEGGRKIQQDVDNAPTTKGYEKLASSGGDDDKKAWDDMDKKVKEEAPKSGVSKSIHDVYQDGYVGANGQAVQSQPDKIGSVSFTQQSDIMRNIKTRDGSMYDNGGADIVYASQNAVELVNRFTREGGDFREMLTEFIQNHSGRSPQYAEAVADRWISKMNDGPGRLTKGKAILSLSSSMRAEGMSRLRRWLVRAEYNGFNAKTRGFMDDFLFRHMQMDSIKNNRSIQRMMTKALNGLTGLRYRALFYGNIKNALLQVSELSRLFTVFKWGDVGNMLKRLATDEGFRARVDTYVEAVSPETTYLDSELYGKYQQVADSAKVDNDGITFRKLAGDAKDTADKIGLAPINAAENLKNRTMIAALVQEADRMGLSGDEALRHIRSRFERVALANNEMGRIGLASNPLAKPMLFLQNFQIRELGMHYYNIKDATGMATSMPKRILEGSKYLTKVFGSKLATTLILTRLGYSATQTLGIDPFGLTGNYTGLSEDEMNALDKQISGGMLTPFFAGGMTSLIADMYFMARAAYEDSNRQTISDEAEANLDGSYGMDWGSVFSLDNAANLASNFAPGNVFLNRIGQMNEMMDTGWATSATGNKMYTAPNDTINTLLGYLFGRSATQNALQYNQTYGNDLGQTLSRTIGQSLADLGQAFGIGGGYQQFDPIDTKNYSDWFNGDDNDRQQFEKGRRYFQQQRDRILDEYEDAIRKSYASNDDVAEAKNNMNQRLESLYEQLDRFVNAYEKKNGTIDANMTKQIVNILNTGRKVLGDTEEEASERSLAAYNDALARYAGRGFSPVGTYSGPTESNPDKEVKYQGSPQYRAAVSGYYDKDDELVDVLKLADKSLEPIRKQLQSKISAAYDSKDYTALESIQQQYLKQFDQVVAPIVAIYGVDTIKKNGEVENQLKAMLSSGSLIPSSQYAKNKKGRYQSMPYEEVDVGAWARQRYSSDTYKNPSVRSNSTAQQDLSEVKRLLRQGKTSLAKAKALRLKVRIEEQEQVLPQQDFTWLNNYLTGKGYN